MQASFCFLLLLVPVLSDLPPTSPPIVPTTSGHTRPTGSKQTVTTQSSPMSRFIDRSSIPALTITRCCGETLPNWPGSVRVESILAFREGATTANNVKAGLVQLGADRFHWDVSGVSAEEVSFPSSSGPGPGVPGWGIALLVLVCVLVALAIVYLLALAVCQCRRKNCGQLDIFPTRDAYHAMSEYPTYHTHGRYVPPGTSKRSPYEEVSAGNGGSGLSYTNPAATSANL
uniref:Mucin 1, cell surface associated n=1 Tax=Pipistrellus kuhlii TaxID=59472 RepID=A0A7J7UU40_PIPKU|nr:mucin 1, cell surface associated [Pipistrellus kuhlii]